MIRGWRHGPEHDLGSDQGDVKPEVTRRLFNIVQEIGAKTIHYSMTSVTTETK
ncbi:hypothetical protein [Bradyrhizobium sp. CB2312]|uniref:hypothetical protein n=1 Tax=Bradyrhizobium sp. CB2312 TaxID=3039155 RepID=UPI0024B1C991|nr:hypothetical protein [Bradyrhizobium sp. CB2312]WFU71146.1 hypothetical protein QA642_38800 [Bradyrhizobium sp. CB2312]